jgi:acyl-coenzyme A thioesterase PaaI-like protein
MTEAAPERDVRRAWLDEDEADLSAARVAKHRLAEQVRRLVDATFQLDAGDAGYDPADVADTGRAARFLALAAEAEALADRVGALPRIPRADIGGVNTSRARRHDILLVERSTINGRGNPLSPPVRMWADGELVRAEAYFTAPYEGPPGRVHGAWVAACFDEILGCAQGASGAFGFTGTLTIALRRATPLYTTIAYEAGFSHREGRKIHAWGRCYADGRLTAEATGVFVIPANGQLGHGACDEGVSQNAVQ